MELIKKNKINDRETVKFSTAQKRIFDCIKIRVINAKIIISKPQYSNSLREKRSAVIIINTP